MPSLHYITHAVTLAVIATLVRKYLHIKYAYEELEDNCRWQEPDSHDNIYETQTPQTHTSSETIPSTFATSIWCHGHNRSTRICKFENLCYNTFVDDFVFIHGKDSVIGGVDPGIIHGEFLDLSSVDGHNLHYLKLSDLPENALQDFKIHWMRGDSLLFDRFKPDNVMHVFHDDLFPLHHTLEIMSFGANSSKTPYDLQLVFMEGWELGEFTDLYSAFTTKMVLEKSELQTLGEMVCFEKGQIGISKVPTWYQYGFDKPQGPIEQSEATSVHIHQTVNYILSVIESEPCFECSGQYIVLISREENRLILNQMDLTLTIAKETNMKVVVVSFATHDLNQMIQIVHKSRGVIGMHGSLMILSAFLRPGSVVIELFPYAINPRNYTPYKTLSELRGMTLIYKSWVNKDKANTVMHPDWPIELGGINELPNQLQNEIISQSEVPLHLCCDDPSWLFHIYQDTKVDIQAVGELLKQSVSEGSKSSEQLHHSLLPSRVRHVTCKVTTDSHLILAWEAPWNLQYLRHSHLEYEIWLQNTEKGTTLSVMTDDMLSLDISKHVISHIPYYVWVRCVVDTANQGPFSDVITCVL